MDLAAPDDGQEGNQDFPGSSPSGPAQLSADAAVDAAKIIAPVMDAALGTGVACPELLA